MNAGGVGLLTLMKKLRVVNPTGVVILSALFTLSDVVISTLKLVFLSKPNLGELQGTTWKIRTATLTIIITLPVLWKMNIIILTIITIAIILLLPLIIIIILIIII